MLFFENILSKALLFGSTAKFFQSVYFLKKEKLNISLFEEFEKAPIFDFDYIKNIDEIPKNKLIALCAQTDNDSRSLINSKIINEKKILFSSISEDYNENDKFWLESKENKINFNVRNMMGDTINVKNNDDVHFFNLSKISKPFNQANFAINMTFIQKLKNMIGKKTFFNEYAIIPENRYVLIGTLIKKEEIYEFYPRCVSNESKDLLLKYLDELIVNINKEGKKCLGIAMILLILHFIFIKVVIRYYKIETLKKNKGK